MRPSPEEHKFPFSKSDESLPSLLESIRCLFPVFLQNSSFGSLINSGFCSRIICRAVSLFSFRSFPVIFAEFRQSSSDQKDAAPEDPSLGRPYCSSSFLFCEIRLRTFKNPNYPPIQILQFREHPWGLGVMGARIIARS
jgi:hypothetical protein